ncbi:helix-turn-helix domain-containing protein [Planotetraspora sp. A-T 1434]|uniref:helix-turn-helix domain-containing protein n=1 Tax=Planotetraspora sp. A-T 1434 TaxID=2979219 RepID=UPI0021C1345C|nr:helix-turn-helix domain-containing protein [Planotetraspora sp. A-T 1434]MCT9932873.1 helix-turn-helix domain-containing protein [Planotetraspora sp. A-T 1434]
MSVGAALSEARQQARLTVSQLSSRTHIREAIIDGIERDDFSACGGDFYARGHIRAIASYLGLEPEDIIREYDEVHGGAPPPVRAATVFKVDDAHRGNHMRRVPGWTVAVAVALAVIVVFVLVRLLSGSGGKGQAAELRISAPEAAAQHARAPAPAARERVVLKVFAVKPTWINVKDAKGHRLFQGALQQGKSSTWSAEDRLRVTIGDAGAVRLEVNGKDVGTLGKDGQTVKRSFGAGIPSAR